MLILLYGVYKMAQTITHRGTVKSVDGKHIAVEIMQASACTSCVARKLCNSSESKNKLVDVYTSDASSYKVGEEVCLVGSLEMGLSAVWWAYIAPLILLVAVLLAVAQTIGNEPLAALTALGSLALYYVMLYLCRGKLARKFSFTIKHIK